MLEKKSWKKIMNKKFWKKIFQIENIHNKNL